MADSQNGKNRNRRRQLLDALSIAGRESSTATVMFHTAMAERAGLTATDAKTMDILARHGSLTAGELSSHTGLATASVTSLIDRLEARGMVRRVRDRADRRRVIVETVRENAEGDTSFFGAMQSTIEALVKAGVPSEAHIFAKGTRNHSRTIRKGQNRSRSAVSSTKNEENQGAITCQFHGTRENAVKTQIWIAVSVYVLVAIVRKRLGLEASLSKILQVLSATLF